tara:strand:+ start:46 stop:330 length:285 start_codon:yes stop_codon:yes gene_type:complete
MKVGDMVRYRGWSKTTRNEPLALVVDQRNPDSSFHHRIRVMWVGDEVPIQASALSTEGKRVTTWVNPKYFELIESPELEKHEDPDWIWMIWGDQ